jgi:hypothetical protein
MHLRVRLRSAFVYALCFAISLSTVAAEHYRASKTVLGYDLLNEPIPPFPALLKYNSQLDRSNVAS